MPAKAKIAHSKDGKTYLVRGRQRDELQPLVASAEDLAAVAGQQVEVEVETRQTIVGFRTPEVRVVCYLPVRPRNWSCYIPRPELIEGIQEKIRENLIERMVEQGVIDRQTAEKLR